MIFIEDLSPPRRRHLIAAALLAALCAGCASTPTASEGEAKARRWAADLGRRVLPAALFRSAAEIEPTNPALEAKRAEMITEAPKTYPSLADMPAAPPVLADAAERERLREALERAEDAAAAAGAQNAARSAAEDDNKTENGDDNGDENGDAGN